jgi:hypothetical protein
VEVYSEQSCQGTWCPLISRGTNREKQDAVRFVVLARMLHFALPLKKSINSIESINPITV